MMRLSTVLYLIIIRPIELMLGFVVDISLRFTDSIGISIIILSLLVNLLVLPLYSRADKIQKKEYEKRKRIEKWEKHIKASFKGEERFLMMETLYRQNGYKPYQSLNNIVPLLLEIPFFIGAYRFLSSLPIINGISFMWIKDLGSPDGLLNIGVYTIMNP